MAASDQQDSLAGLALALSAYGLWGFLPLYLKLLDGVPALEVVAHRVVWSIPVAALLLIALGRTGDLREAIRSPAMLGMGCVTAALISVNWLTYVWAIETDRALDAALGYYINPLFSIFLGRIVLGEELNRLQWIAVALAAAAVAYLTVASGTVPVVGLILMSTFGLYALAKKQLPIGPNQGFLLEVLVLMPVALGYIAWLSGTGAGHFTEAPLLLMGCGLVTAVPLILYANSAKRLKLSTNGILQYTVPTSILLIAVFIFREPFGAVNAVAFPMIWTALGLYSVSLFQQQRQRRARPSPA